MAKETRPIMGRVVAITGGARGIGKATARALVREGARVAIGDIDVDLARQTAEELGSGTRAYYLDVTDRASFERFLDEVERDFGTIDVLINNAGIMHVNRFVEEDDAAAERQIDINLKGVIIGSKLFIRRAIERGRSGHLVNVASQAGKAGYPGIATYCATKHAVVGLSQALALEYEDRGIDVSCVMPVVVDTELGQGIRDARGFKKIKPDDVAREIVAALRRPRFNVHVPKSVGPVGKIIQLLPERGQRLAAKLFGTDRLLLDAIGRREEYERRAARSEPSRSGQSALPAGSDVRLPEGVAEEQKSEARR
ncbi:SDR family oxidoreductase [Thermoleophilum album]|uniref:NADP-dependent 3-hydroxy acid dehydrogenase YdfG n=1 Tax=Thermoleophilum album TaxID=29539 RepID=A0A1H6FK95_THEAL|nr:SDR family oxidoreductase [Thermoleophilum album]SEH10234.1 NADP-dependent 3-hydroxy acid dehydrogenase YdfG [Thermoleophilum album]